MIWIPVTTCLSFGFGQLFKWSQRRGCYAPAVLATNYLVVAGLLLLYHLLGEGLNFAGPVLFLGCVTGCSFILSMSLMTRALEIANVAAVLTAFRLAILVPIGASVLLWGEEVSAIQLTGMAMAAAALVLMTRRGGHGGKEGRRDLSLAFLVFALQGVSQTCLRWVHYAGLDSQRLHVLFITAATAGLLGSLVVLIRRRRLVAADLHMGGGIGVYNLVALGVLLTALSMVAGTTFFPIHGCGVVILDSLFAHFYWKERLGPLAALGALLGASSMLLVL
ncbi:MAG: hypothetical protein VX911_09590 [Candidatus Latescibacterota bacterium]|nr:hypothetical protein [Candidatus Latescibacterota bacterium]